MAARSAALRLETSEWRKKEGPPQHVGAQKMRGAQRNVFGQRIEAHYARFYREAAEHLRQWAEMSRRTSGVPA